MTNSSQPRGNSFTRGGRAVHNPGAFAPATQSAPEGGSLLTPKTTRGGLRSDDALSRQMQVYASAATPGASAAVSSSAAAGSSLHAMLESAFEGDSWYAADRDTSDPAGVPFHGIDDRAERREYEDALRFKRDTELHIATMNARHALEDDERERRESADATPGDVARTIEKPAGGLLHEVPENRAVPAAEPNVDDPGLDW